MANSSRVLFLFDEERDLKNIYNTANTSDLWGKPINVPEKIAKIVGGKTYEECKGELKEFRKRIYESEIFKEFLKMVDTSWGKIEREYFARLEKMTGKKVEGEFKAYITTVGRCPYNPFDNSFMIFFFSGIPDIMRSIGHEILHLHFHKIYFEDIAVKIGRDRAHNLKEALTVLLNVEFKDLWFVNDDGYPAHAELRKYILMEWEKEKNFDKLVEKSSNFLG